MKLDVHHSLQLPIPNSQLPKRLRLSASLDESRDSYDSAARSTNRIVRISERRGHVQLLWELEVGSWELKASVEDPVQKPIARLTIVKQSICFASRQCHVPFVSVPEMRIPPRARCTPWPSTHRDTSSCKPTSIRHHSRRLS